MLIQVIQGCDCWINALQRFGKHKSSAFHCSEIGGFFNNKKPRICEQISQSKDQNMQKSRIP